MSSSNSSQCHYNFGSVATQTLQLLDKGSVTQGTAITSGVDLPSPVGLVRTVSASLTTAGSASFVASYSDISVNSIVFASICGYSGNGTPHVRVSSVTSGSCTLTLRNSDFGAALNAPVTIAYRIL